MTAVEKLAEERDELKSARVERIMISSFSLFSNKGIDAIAMTDIAKHAEIGVASLYRYFETKDEIAIRTAIWAWESRKKVIFLFWKIQAIMKKMVFLSWKKYFHFSVSYIRMSRTFSATFIFLMPMRYVRKLNRNV